MKNFATKKTNPNLLIFLTFLIMVGISIFNLSCKKNERALKKIASFENLSKDKDFINLLRMNDEFLTKIPDIKTAVKIYKSKTEDGSSFLELAHALGFKSTGEYVNFFNIQSSYKESLNEKYDFEHLSATEKSILVNSLGVLIQDSYNPNVTRQFSVGKIAVADPNGPNCSERRSNCNRSSTAIYTLEGLGCIGASALVGSGTFGLGGAVIYGICISAAAVHYDSMLNDCTYAYEDCLGNRAAE